MARSDRWILGLSFSDGYKAEVVRTVVAYESAVRGMTMGQALCALLVEGAADCVADERLRERLAEIRDAWDREAADEALAALGGVERSA